MKVIRLGIILSVVFWASGILHAEEPHVDISIDSEYRWIKSNGIPDHEHGIFPNRGNPNSMSAQSYSFRVPLNPVRSMTSTPLTNRTFFGVALNGVPFDPGTAEFYYNDPSSGWQYEALSGELDLGIDFSNGHVQPNGAYHYHGIPKGIVTSFKVREHSKIIGYAADGFPIYAVAGYKDPKDPSKGLTGIRSSYLVKKGIRPTGPGGSYDGTFVQDYIYYKNSGDLDECNGRFGITPDYPDGIYHYFLTDSYPFIPRCFRGTPDKTFSKKRPHAQQDQRVGGERGYRPDRPHRRRVIEGSGRPGRPPQDAINACVAQLEGVRCSFRAPHGQVIGSCRMVSGVNACVPDRRPLR